MNDDSTDAAAGLQVGSDVIAHILSSSSSTHVDQWLADVTQRQHGAADRLCKLTCDCTFCVPPISDTLTGFRSSKNTDAQSSTSSTTTTNNKPVFTCASCARSFASEKYLNMHAALHRKTTTNSLTRSITQPMTLTAGLHTPGSGAKEKWTCEVCGKIFAHTSNYKNHIRTHSDDRPFVCHVCSIGFKERYHLKKHTLFKHTGDLNEACRRCGKRFKDSTAVRAHERIHSDERPYACQRCGKAFKTSECLWHHDHRSKTCGRPRRTVDRRPVTCQQAAVTTFNNQSNSHTSPVSDNIKSFLPARALTTATQHSQQSAVKAEDPGVLMLNSSDMKIDNSDMATPASVAAMPCTKPVAVVIGQHITGSGIKQRSICSRCGKQFASSPAFERHLAVHSVTRPYRCHICDVGFKLKVHLKKHNLYRHNSDYPCQCRVCGKPFKDSSAVRLHERIHSSARPFQCVCGKSFKTRENLWGHRHRRPCVGRYNSCAAAAAAAACYGGVSQATHDSITFVQPTSLSENMDSTLVSAVPAVSDDLAVTANDTDAGLLMFDTTDCINVDSKLLPPFETFIPPLRATDLHVPTNSTPLVRCHGYSGDWSSTPVPPDIIWWSSAAGNYQTSPAVIASHLSDDDWSIDWQSARKLAM